VEQYELVTDHWCELKTGEKRRWEDRTKMHLNANLVVPTVIVETFAGGSRRTSMVAAELGEG
jgi:hypothetical protein